MDYQNRAGSKFGGGGMATKSEAERQRKERLKQLALETINIDKDPYIAKVLGGGFECRLCQTAHASEGSYLSHTQGKRHQMNLARRAKTGKGKYGTSESATPGPAVTSTNIKVKKTVKIGRPGYKITKIRDQLTKQVGLLFQVKYPEIGTGVTPKYRFMSAYEQKVEQPDPGYQYLLVAAEPYETCAFKIESKEIDNAKGRFWTHYDPDTKDYYLQLFYKSL